MHLHEVENRRSQVQWLLIKIWSLLRGRSPAISCWALVQNENKKLAQEFIGARTATQNKNAKAACSRVAGQVFRYYFLFYADIWPICRFSTKKGHRRYRQSPQ